MFGSSVFGKAAFGSVAGGASGPAIETITLPIVVTMTTSVIETIALPIRASIVATQSLSLPTVVTILSGTVVSPARWRPVVTLDGVDVSERLVGEISVQAGENEARVASFQLRPASGSLILPDWTGRSVTIDIAAQEPDGSASDARRLFTGVVDVPEYDISGHVVSFDCTDQRQEVIGNTPREWLDAAIGGHYSAAVSGEPTDTLDYASARLASVPAALDLDAYQSPRVTIWALPEPAWLILGESEVIDGSLRIQLASRADLRNEITTRFQYRLPRLRARVIECQFERTIGQYTSQGLDIPSRAMIEQALGGLSGWSQLGLINYVAVDAGAYESVGGGGSIFTVISSTDAPNLALGFGASFYSRWVQSVTEDYALTVRAQASIDAIGQARESLDGATLDSEFDDAAWLNDPATEPELTLPPVGDVSLDYGVSGASDRAAAEAAIETLVAQARTATLASHRTTRVSAAIAIRADLDLDKRIEIDTAILRASGKVARVAHRMSIDDGSAVTEFDLAVSGFNAVGLQPDNAPAAPAAPVDPTPAPGAAQLAATIGLHIGQTFTSAPYDEDTMIGFSTNARAGADFDPLGAAYPLAMSIGAPEIEAAVRDPITLTQTATYAVAIPQDILEVTVP